MSITPLFTSPWNFDKIHPPGLEKMTLVSAAVICVIAKVLEEEAAVVLISSDADNSGLLGLIVLRFDTNEYPSSLHVPMKFWQDPSTELGENYIGVRCRNLFHSKSSGGGGSSHIDQFRTDADYSGLLDLIVLKFDTNEDSSSLHVTMKFWQDPSSDLGENGIGIHRRNLSFEKSMMIHIIESEGALVIGRGLYLVVVAVYCIDTTQKITIFYWST